MNKIDSDIPMRLRGLNRIQSDNFVDVSYHSMRSKLDSPRTFIGEVSEVEEGLEDGYVRFYFSDEEKDRDLKVTLGNTTGSSQIRSRKNDRWTTLGTPLRVCVFEEIGSRGDVTNRVVHETNKGRHESAVAAAEVKWNKDILQWFDWSEEHA